MKPGDKVRAWSGSRLEVGTIAYVGAVAYGVDFKLEGCDEPVRRLYRFDEVEAATDE